MTERDYIVVSSLTRVRVVREAMAHVAAFESLGAALPANEVWQVNRLLSEWEDKLAKLVTVRT